MWNFGNDEDIFSYCKDDMEVGIHQEREGDPNRWWAVIQTFTNRPQRRCQDETIEDPVLQPPRISGSFVRFTEEAILDRFNLPILTSSHESIRGPQNEWDNSRPTVRFEHNQPDLNYATLSTLVDRVNDAPMWGLPRRCVKLSNFDWEENYYGQCYKYYHITLQFEINVNTFDREVLDEGTKVLRGKWHPVTGRWVLTNKNGEAPDRYNPSHFERADDPKGNPIRILLNGEGRPATDVVHGVGTGTSYNGLARVRIEKYIESNLLLTGAPPNIF
jgi:hypothetical protein